MEVRIGTTVEGQAAGFDTSSARPLLLVGDVGRGKTTIARYLARWWLADTVRHAHVFSGSPGEWADLCCEREHPDFLRGPVGRDCRPGACLVVVDDIDLTGDEDLALLPLGMARTILTAHGGIRLSDRALFEGDVISLGLVRQNPADPGEVAVLEGQGRLDWPAGTVAVAPGRAGADGLSLSPLAGTRRWVGGGPVSMERSRRDRFATNTVPLTWEIPVAVILAGLFFILITPLVVQCLVGWVRAGEFVWPSGHLLDAYGGLLHGHFGAGLRHGVDAGLPPDAVMWLLTILGEVLVLGAAVVVGLWMRDLTGTNSRHGLATAAQAAQALGLPRLRKSAAVIRPDLYARAGHQKPVGGGQNPLPRVGRDPSWPQA